LEELWTNLNFDLDWTFLRAALREDLDAFFARI